MATKPVDRHDADHAFVAGVGHQRLEHLPFVIAEFARGFEAVPFRIVVAVFVLVDGERDARLFKLCDGRRGSRLLFLFAHVHQCRAAVWQQNRASA